MRKEELSYKIDRAFNMAVKLRKPFMFRHKGQWFYSTPDYRTNMAAYDYCQKHSKG